MQSKAPSIPVIDISALLEKELCSWEDIIESLDSTCRHTGFFYITGHGINLELISKILTLAQDFFDQDITTKSQHLRSNNKYLLGYSPIGAETLSLDLKNFDYKESFDVSPDLSNNDPSLYPNMPEFKKIILDYYQELNNISMLLLEAMALALGEAKNCFTDHFKGNSGIILRLNHYPPCANQIIDSIIAGAHTDYGYLTLLYQDDVGGLQIRSKNKTWIDVPYLENSFVVNIGDLMQRLTNNIYKSTTHRVLLKNSNKSRISIPYFVEPNYNTVIKCLPSCVSTDRPAQYPPVVSGEWITAKLKKTYSAVSQV